MSKSSTSALSSATLSSQIPQSTPPSEQSFSALQAINNSVTEWHVQHLPPNITIQANGTILYKNSNSTTTLTRMNSTSVGSVPIISFIYLIMSLAIVIFMVRPSSHWILALTSPKSHKHKYEPILSSTKLTERRFATQLQAAYPPHAISQAETVSSTDGTGSQDVRECGELIRAKFGLDVDIWNLRDVTRVNRPVVEEKERRSEGAMSDIQRVVSTWVARKGDWSEEEWKIVEQIGERVGGLRMRRDG